MTVASMTGFARADGGDAEIQWVWEVKSVNGKSLDMRVRVPSGWERLDPLARRLVGAVLKRGNLSLTLEVRRTSDEPPLQVNETLLAELVRQCRALGEEPRVDRLLSVRGVVETADRTSDAAADEDRIAAVAATLEDALDQLVSMRQDEGARIASILRDRLGEIEQLTGDAASCADAQSDAVRDRLRTQIEELLEDGRVLTPDRLAQEVAILAVKADVREEIDRLFGHVEAARALLDEGGACGRRLDFLCQEFNREANTLCSKSTALEMTRIGLDLKSAVDQLREQVQNLE